jgi:hypothetical protein
LFWLCAHDWAGRESPRFFGCAGGCEVPPQAGGALKGIPCHKLPALPGDSKNVLRACAACGDWAVEQSMGSNITDQQMAYGAGLVEGYLTQARIYQVCVCVSVWCVCARAH